MATSEVKYRDNVWKARHRAGQKTNKVLKKALKRVRVGIARLFVLKLNGFEERLTARYPTLLLTATAPCKPLVGKRV